MRSVIVRALAVVAAAVLAACTSAPPSSGGTEQPAAAVTSPPPSGSSSAGISLKPTPLPLTFQTSAQQARMVATLVAFLDAYNSGRVEAALALLTDDVAISDCDYRAVRVITANGAEAARQWLRERAADHDQLVLESVRNDNPDPTTGSHVVGAAFTRRTSDTLRSLGFPNGIAPHLVAKVVFTAPDDRIRAFANGPFGGSAEQCRPSS